MDIYAKEGTKVKYTGNGGYDSHKEHANKYLKVGETYTVLKTNVTGWYTSVILQEVPSHGFNSVHFDDLKQGGSLADESDVDYKTQLIKQIGELGADDTQHPWFYEGYGFAISNAIEIIKKFVLQT